MDFGTWCSQICKHAMCNFSEWTNVVFDFLSSDGYILRTVTWLSITSWKRCFETIRDHHHKTEIKTYTTTYGVHLNNNAETRKATTTISHYFGRIDIMDFWYSRHYRKTLPPDVFKFGPLPNAYISCSTRALFHFSVYFTHYCAIYVKMSTYLQFHLA